MIYVSSSVTLSIILFVCHLNLIDFTPITKAVEMSMYVPSYGKVTQNTNKVMQITHELTLTTNQTSFRNDTLAWSYGEGITSTNNVTLTTNKPHQQSNGSLEVTATNRSDVKTVNISIASNISKGGVTKQRARKKVHHRISNCEIYRKEGKNTYNITRVIGGENKTNSSHPHDITLLTQLNVDRIGMLADIVQAWTGPMNIAVYGTDKELNSSLATLLKIHRQGVQIHLVQKKGTLYPINHLRNIGILTSATPYIFTIDVDFVPNENLYEMLKQYIMDGLFTNSKTAAIVPVFKTTFTNVTLPKDKSELVEQWNNNITMPYKSTTGYSRGHRSTKYETWRSTNNTYEVKHTDPSFEPYVLIKRAISPLYSRTFMQRYYDKICYIDILKHASFKFVVLPDAFLVHRPHKTDVQRWQAKISRCATQARTEFKRWLSHQTKFFYLSQNQTNSGDLARHGL